ncbi:MAG TPA: hypothetical protein VFA12_19080 [Stellaceae bacterium]|nr:hypothetical protein [Stellaceae bacterium]
MTNIVPRLCAVVAALALATGVYGIAAAQAPGPASNQLPPSGYSPDQGPDSSAAGPAGASRPLEMPILYVTDVEVLRTTVGPQLDIVRATGLVSSQGWSGPTLVPFFYGKPADEVLDLQFIATSPQQSQKAEGFVPVSAIFTLDNTSAYKGIRVRAGANAIELKQIPGKAEAKIKANDGKDLIGKKFVEKGPAGAGVVTAEELPRGFRTITPTHGVAGIVHNPNRLNLILDGDNKIVMAFWE